MEFGAYDISAVSDFWPFAQESPVLLSLNYAPFEATLRLSSGYPEATLGGKVHPDGRKMAQSPASCVFTISSAYLFFTKMWVMTSPKATHKRR